MYSIEIIVNQTANWVLFIENSFDLLWRGNCLRTHVDKPQYNKEKYAAYGNNLTLRSQT